MLPQIYVAIMTSLGHNVNQENPYENFFLQSLMS